MAEVEHDPEIAIEEQAGFVYFSTELKKAQERLRQDPKRLQEAQEFWRKQRLEQLRRARMLEREREFQKFLDRFAKMKTPALWTVVFTLALSLGEIAYECRNEQKPLLGQMDREVAEVYAKHKLLRDRLNEWYGTEIEKVRRMKPGTERNRAYQELVSAYRARKQQIDRDFINERYDVQVKHGSVIAPRFVECLKTKILYERK
jgi:hypothetical protein